MNSTGWPPNTPYDCAEARRTQVADATFRDKDEEFHHIFPMPKAPWLSNVNAAWCTRLVELSNLLDCH